MVNLPLALVCLVVSIAVIVKGGDIFVSAASWMAEVSGIPKLIVGATVVSMATTLPEMLVSAFSAVSARATGDAAYIDMSIGNAVGSVTANTGMILAIALLFMAGTIRRKDYYLKAALFIGAAAAIAAFGATGAIGLIPNLILVVLFVVAMTENVVVAVRKVKAGNGGEPDGTLDARPESSGKLWTKNVLLFLLGAAAIGIGANVLVSSAEYVAKTVGVPERVIAVTILAVGTSLPELVTTVTAVVKREMSLSAGNIIGANIMDMTLIMPICGLISGKALPVTAQVGRIDLPASLLVALLALIPALVKGKFMRWQGIALLAVYIGYLVLTCFFGDKIAAL